jgi:uncharacterized protein YhhL (DUF1145 family)
MIDFIQLHCAMLVLLVGIILIYNLFSPAEFPMICLVLVVAIAIVLIFLRPVMFKSLFEVNKTKAVEKVEVYDTLRM